MDPGVNRGRGPGPGPGWTRRRDALLRHG